MAIKKIKKSSATLGGILYAIIITISIFTATFLYIEANSEDVAAPITNSIYNETYLRIKEKQNTLDKTINNFRNSISQVTEPGANFGISWNGLLGLLGVFLIPLQLIDISVETLNIIIAPIAIVIPVWLLNILKISIIIFIILIIASILKGDNNVIK